MMLLLISNIRNHPFQIPSPERNDAIAILPLQRFANVMGTRSLDLADPFIKIYGRLNRYDQMHVILNPANGVKKYIRSCNNSIFDKCVEFGLDGFRDKWQIVLRMPGNMEIDLRINSSRHFVAKAGRVRALKRPVVNFDIVSTP